MALIKTIFTMNGADDNQSLQRRFSREQDLTLCSDSASVVSAVTLPPELHKTQRQQMQHSIKSCSTASTHFSNSCTSAARPTLLKNLTGLKAARKPSLHSSFSSNASSLMSEMLTEDVPELTTSPPSNKLKRLLWNAPPIHLPRLSARESFVLFRDGREERHIERPLRSVVTPPVFQSKSSCDYTSGNGYDVTNRKQLQDQVVELEDRSCITSRKHLEEQVHHHDDCNDEVDYVLFPGETLSPLKPLQQCEGVSIASKQSSAWSTIYENCSTDQQEDDAALVAVTVIVSFYLVMPKCIKRRF